MSADDLLSLSHDALAKHAQEGWDLAASLRAELTRLRESHKGLHRRCQEAESAARVKVDEVARAGPSLGRAIAGWAAADWKREAEELRTALRAIRQVLGDACSHNSCEASRYEMAEADRIAGAILARFPERGLAQKQGKAT